MNNHYKHQENHRHINHHTSEYEEGILTATSSGNVKITLSFIPDEVEAIFIDPEIHHHHCGGDDQDSVTIKFSGNSTEFSLFWIVNSTRVIKWMAKSIKK